MRIEDLRETAASFGFEELRVADVAALSRAYPRAELPGRCQESPQLCMLMFRCPPYAYERAGGAAISAYYLISHRAYHNAALMAKALREQGVSAQRVDDPPALKPLAAAMGLGRTGVNTLNAHGKYGSYIGYQLLRGDFGIAGDSVDPAIDLDPACIDCDLCAAACPTGAIGAPGAFDAQRCLRMHMLAKSAVPQDMRAAMGNRFVGCETCQRVCPRNHDIPDAASPEALRRLLDVRALLEDAGVIRELGEWIGGNVARPLRVRAQAALIAGSLRLSGCRDALEKLAAQGEEPVAEHARWALARLAQKGH